MEHQWVQQQDEQQSEQQVAAVYGQQREYQGAAVYEQHIEQEGEGREAADEAAVEGRVKTQRA
jgi:hypothetical protein